MSFFLHQYGNMHTVDELQKAFETTLPSARTLMNFDQLYVLQAIPIVQIGVV